MRLSELLRDWRWAQRLTVRDAAEQIGLTPATYSRVERGEQCEGVTLATIVRWMLERVEPKAAEPAAEEQTGLEVIS